MNKNHSKILKDYVKKFCGETPPDFKQVEIQNDSNFIFQNDPNFNSVQLFDVEGNSVFVNSFLECQHYVSGGWDYIPFQRHESDYHMFLLYFSLIIIFLTYAFSKSRIRKLFR
tara:strand:+ start:287 stop:625 length:339 start_codon:yes stop_codon:yes gene_type:complete